MKHILSHQPACSPDDVSLAFAAAERFADMIIEAERRGIVAVRVKPGPIAWRPIKRVVWKGSRK